MKLIGHRGAKGLAPENTVAALRQGLAHHVDELEIDVRVTKDKVVVLQHDPQVTSAAGGQYLVKNHTFTELHKHKPDLVTLKDALIAVDRTVPVQIEIKPNEPVEPIIAVIADLLRNGWTRNDILFGSFDQSILVALHTAYPDIPKVIIDNWSAIRAVRRARQVKAKRLSMSQRWMWWPVVHNLRMMGFQLAVYTVNKPTQIGRWSRHGLYGVITDYPDRFDFK